MLHSMDLRTFEAKAGKVADTLKAMGNGRRLMLLCKLVEHGEMTASDLASEVGLSQPACSQHLARMRSAERVSASPLARSKSSTGSITAAMRVAGSPTR